MMRSALAACTIRKNMLADSAFWGHRETFHLQTVSQRPQRPSPASAAALEHLSGRITLQRSTANAAGTASRT